MDEQTAGELGKTSVEDGCSVDVSEALLRRGLDGILLEVVEGVEELFTTVDTEVR